ncbi:MAG: hypothetical protein R3C49_04145 [Planctomycetaceae bacterium]
MARHEADKEDLMVEATALVERAEYQCRSDDSEACSWSVVTVGFRRDQSLSVYFDQNPFYQFDPEGRLRRAHVDGLLYRSQTTTLACLQRARTETATTLLRRDLDESELRQFRNRLRLLLTNLQQLFERQELVCLREVTSVADFATRVSESLNRILSHTDSFLSSAIRQRQ